MKTAIKIIILLLAITCAIGGVMIYAKTKVAPPIVAFQTNQYIKDVDDLVAEENAASGAEQEDEVLLRAVDRIHFFKQEGKMDAATADKCLDKFVHNYSSDFLKRSFAAFDQPVWNDGTHNYILTQSALLKGLTHSDSTPVMTGSTMDSLNLVASIISDYRNARRLCSTLTFRGYDNAEAIINKASTYADNEYLSNCPTLINDLRAIKSNLANSCYNQIVAKVEELANYGNYTKEYYDNTLVPNVDRAVTEYDNKAVSVFGSKENVSELWNRAKSYYNNAMAYFRE